MVTDKQKSNLIPFKPGQCGNPRGRPSFRAMMKKLPKDAQEKAQQVLWAALSMPNQREAMSYLQEKSEELPECGFMFQVVLKGLMGKDGAWVLGAVLDRLFGRPRQQAEVKHTGNTGGIQVVVQSPETADLVNGLIADAKAGRHIGPGEEEKGPNKEG